jgi:dinuclear metal center YbgI/SA1388 family protein
MNNIALLNLLDQLLTPINFKDYCPNGLQIQGGQNCKKLLCAVSISERLIDYAIENNYDAILVHHGIFWHKMPYNITGIQYNRISKLIKNDINLYAYHLPLDNHPEFGNNVQLARVLNIDVSGQTGEQNLLWFGNLKSSIKLESFIDFYIQKTNHQPVYFGDENKHLSKVAWCTGAAVNMFYNAIELGVDCYITGEINEQIMSLSKESGVCYIAGGHYITEQFGIKALCEYLNQFIQSYYLEIYNPI